MIEETSHKRTKLSSLCFVLKGQLKYQNWKKKFWVVPVSIILLFKWKEQRKKSILRKQK